MNELVYLKKDDAFTDSLVIAEGTGNQHKSIVAIIKKYRKDFEECGRLDFSDFKSTKSKGRPTRIYHLNEEQATLLITYLDNNEVVRSFKKRLVHQFYEMRKFIAERQTQAWIETRQQGKITRRSETDVIQELVSYAKAQGSEHADMLYMAYSKLANAMCGVKGRDNATTYQLNNLSIFENLILQMIRSGIQAEMHYKDIYKLCKDRCVQAKKIAMIGG